MPAPRKGPVIRAGAAGAGTALALWAGSAFAAQPPDALAAVPPWLIYLTPAIAALIEALAEFIRARAKRKATRRRATP
jgi:apolipoprotein N-acyltransferase